MNKPLVRAYLVELLGTFILVLFAAGIVCVNTLTLPQGQEPGKTALFDTQPGLVGIALAQGLVLAVALVLTMHVSGGYLNPAITIMLWVFNRMPSVRAAWLIGAQLLGGVLAGAVVRFTFEEKVLETARLGTPHMNRLAFPELKWESLAAGACIELILTFFLVFAIFGSIRSKGQWETLEEGNRLPDSDFEGQFRSIDTRLAALMAGLALAACVLFAFPLTGAAVNPARWFGPAFWEWALFQSQSNAPNSFADMFVYIAGPIVGALLGGLVFFKLMPISDKEKVKSKK